MTTATLTCLRPMPATGEQRREQLRKGDAGRCQCGLPTCRDIDVYRKDKS